MTETRRLTTSVVIITKNRPGLLANVLESLTRQSLVPDEVLVVDNNSSLSYRSVLDRYQGKLPLRAVVEKIPGIPSARNRGIREARGDIIAFTDDDCEADPGWLENIVKPFYQNPFIGIVGGEILSTEKGRSLVEDFCISETLMQIGRRDGGPHDH